MVRLLSMSLGKDEILTQSWSLPQAAQKANKELQQHKVSTSKVQPAKSMPTSAVAEWKPAAVLAPVAAAPAVDSPPHWSGTSALADECHTAGPADAACYAAIQFAASTGIHTVSRLFIHTRVRQEVLLFILYTLM